MIKLNNVSFHYNEEKMIFDNVTTMFKKNRITGLIGRNGSGKSTLLSLINTLLKVNNGEITYDEEIIFENQKILDEISYIYSQYPIVGNLKTKKLLKFRAKNDNKFNYDKAIKYLELFGINMNDRTNKLSRGETSIVHAIIGLSMETGVVIFDEVELGMDDERKEIFYEQILVNQQDDPKTVIIATNVFSSTKEIFEDIKLIHNNKIIIDSNYEKFLNQYVVYTTNDINEINDIEYSLIEEKASYYKVLVKHNDLKNKNQGIKDKPTLELLFEILTKEQTI